MVVKFHKKTSHTYLNSIPYIYNKQAALDELASTSCSESESGSPEQAMHELIYLIRRFEIGYDELEHIKSQDLAACLLDPGVAVEAKHLLSQAHRYLCRNTATAGHVDYASITGLIKSADNNKIKTQLVWMLGYAIEANQATDSELADEQAWVIIKMFSLITITIKFKFF
jgi:hypothetical protein